MIPLLCLLRLFVRFVSQQQSCHAPPPRGPWEYGGGTALPLGSQLPGWVRCRSRCLSTRPPAAEHRCSGSAPGGTEVFLGAVSLPWWETRMKYTSGGRNSMCKGHRLYLCSSQVWTPPLNSCSCTPELLGRQGKAVAHGRGWSSGQGQRSWTVPCPSSPAAGPVGSSSSQQGLAITTFSSHSHLGNAND